jgi:large subunit ribosomal protein L15
MDILNQLTKTTAKSAKRRGRGAGSGAGGHFTGRGGKGDKMRGTTKLTFDGTKIKKSWIKRLPFMRGKHLNQSLSSVLVFNLLQLNQWYQANETVDRLTLAKKSGLNPKKLQGEIKILGNGKLTKPLIFKGLYFSQSAKDQIIAAGGKIEA